MAKRPPRPTDAELNLLRVLWDDGPATVRQVREGLSPKLRTGYTTVLKTLQIMTEKGLVRRDEHGLHGQASLHRRVELLQAVRVVEERGGEQRDRRLCLRTTHRGVLWCQRSAECSASGRQDARPALALATG